jgi:hypothetical protein
MKPTIEQIKTDFSAIEENVKALSTEEQAEVVAELDKTNLNEFSPENFDNLKKFLGSISEENRTKFVLNVVDNAEEKSQELKNFMKENYKAELTAIMEQSNTES